MLSTQGWQLWHRLLDYVPRETSSDYFNVPRETLVKDNLLTLYNKQIWQELFEDERVGFDDDELTINLNKRILPKPVRSADF